jgi:hypothetical protein
MPTHLFVMLPLVGLYILPTVTYEDDCFRRVRWNIHRNLPTTVVLERLGDKPPENAPAGLASAARGREECTPFYDEGFLNSEVSLLNRGYDCLRSSLSPSCDTAIYQRTECFHWQLSEEPPTRSILVVD